MAASVFKGLLVFLLAVGMFLPVRAAQAQTVRMATIDFCPFTCDPDGEDGREGFMTDVVRHALQDAGYDLEVSMMPYVRAVEEVRSGMLDGIVVVGKQFAPDLVYPELPVVSQRVAFVVRKGSAWRYGGVQSLKGKVVGIVGGYHYVDEDLQDYLLSRENQDWVDVIHGNNTTERNMLRLLAGRVDVCIEGEFSARYVLEKLGAADQVAFAGFTTGAFEDYVGFSPRSDMAQELAEILTETVRELERTGRKESFLTPYIGDRSREQAP